MVIRVAVAGKISAFESVISQERKLFPSFCVLTASSYNPRRTREIKIETFLLDKFSK